MSNEELNYIRYSLAASLKEIRARLYGEDGYAVREPIFEGLKGGVFQSQDQEAEVADSG